MNNPNEYKLFAEKLKAVIEREGISQPQALERLQLSAEELSEKLKDNKYQECLEIKFQTFKKYLQGMYLKKRLCPLAEIAAYAFEVDGISENHYTDTSLGLDAFKALLGTSPNQEDQPPSDFEKLPPVNKVLFLIKARSSNGTPLLLNYLSADWEILLVPNAAIPEGNNGVHVLKELLAERFGVEPTSLTLDYQPANQARYSRTVKKRGSVEKARKYGPWAYYTFLYCPVTMSRPPDFMLLPSFEIRDVKYRWATLNGLKTDEKIRKLNDDVLEYLSRVYDSTLFHLPVSFQKRIETEE